MHWWCDLDANQAKISINFKSLLLHIILPTKPVPLFKFFSSIKCHHGELKLFSTAAWILSYFAGLIAFFPDFIRFFAYVCVITYWFPLLTVSMKLSWVIIARKAAFSPSGLFIPGSYNRLLSYIKPLSLNCGFLKPQLTEFKCHR